ncbi:hypothetical protein KL936_004476 [Ogataea polymorpha]|nr:hypothetical protein KL936_004476 [Ogataea polymorpha]
MQRPCAEEWCARNVLMERHCAHQNGRPSALQRKICGGAMSAASSTTDGDFSSNSPRTYSSPTTPEAAPQVPLRRQSAPRQQHASPSRRYFACRPRSSRRIERKAGREAHQKERRGAARGAAS